MIQYSVAMNHNYNDFIREVNEHLAIGWKCQGGVGITLDPTAMFTYQWTYFQALVIELPDVVDSEISDVSQGLTPLTAPRKKKR